MFGKKYGHVLGLCLVLATMLALLVGVAHAQDQSVIVIGFEQEPDVLGPGSTSTFSQVTNYLYARKVLDWDDSYKIYPVMLTEVPSVDNGSVITNDQGNTVVTWHLKPGMKWSDGQPITADDCLFGDKLFRDTSTGTILGRGNYPSVVESVAKTDDLTLVETFNTPYPDWYGTDTYIQCAYPEHILQPLMDANGGSIDGLPFFTNGEGVVGYGPYKLESWTHGDNLTFVANENWDGEQPAVQKVILKFITDSNQMQNAFINGEIDMAFNFANDLVDGYRSVPGAEVWNLPEVYADAVWFNVDENGHQNPAIKDANVRKAIVEAINRVDETKQIEGSDSVPGAYDAPNWWPDNLTTIAYNPDQANADLDAAGWVDSNGNGTRDKDGQELILKFFTTTRQDRIDYQTAIAADLQKVGIGTQLFQVPGPAVLFANLTNRGIMASGDYDIAIYANSYDPISPNVSVDTFTCAGLPSPDNPSGSNFSHWCNPDADKLADQIKVNLDPVSRLDQKHQHVQMMVDATFWAGLYQRDWWVAVAGDRFNADSFKGTFGILNDNWLQKLEQWKPA